MASFCPGATTLRVWLHRRRGVRIGKRVWIGYDAIIETSYPSLVEIRDDVTIGIRTVIIAHFRESRGVIIEEKAFIGPGAIIMPKVTIGKGAVVAAGSVVTTPVAPMTLVQGNPAKPIATVGVALDLNTSNKEFLKSLRPIR
jgi:acetyltransferase-like isoleucine patch superfamily enzyme